MNTDSCSINICPIRLELEPERPGYRFTKFSLSFKDLRKTYTYAHF